MSNKAFVGERSVFPAVFDGDLPLELFRCSVEDAIVGWDIETSGLNWRVDRIGTCQIMIPSRGACVVRVGGCRPENLMNLLCDGGVRKVFHHAAFDVSFMMSEWGVVARGAVCTKIGSKILEGPAAGHTLQDLLGRYLGVGLRKDANVRVSNWTSRELTREQVSYAVDDVVFLCRLWEVVEERLRLVGRLDLARAAFDYLPAQIRIAQLGFGDVFSY
ncbi:MULTISPECIES: hypothetical protein [Myxococcus]|nr:MULTISPECIES: hypothetical protein [Myxococcus]NOK03164.1 hypothetical protein [Myxococcus xanthus]